LSVVLEFRVSCTTGTVGGKSSTVTQAQLYALNIKLLKQLPKNHNTSNSWRKMPPRCPTLQGTLTPFLYPFLITTGAPKLSRTLFNSSRLRNEISTPTASTTQDPPAWDAHQHTHLNPPPTDYSRTIFTDRATLTLHAGSGGHGCISFLREKFIAAGPANGGDGGSGGNIYIQAIRGETSLHKLARRNILRAGRGKNGQGKTRGGERGDDIVIEVPLGTVVREVLSERFDPVFIEEHKLKLEAGKEDGVEGSGPWKWDREKWLLYPAITPEDVATAEFPRLPKGRKNP
jgi:GTP-binding protein